jgi:nucleoside-diphosphate-sugar epimerase
VWISEFRIQHSEFRIPVTRRVVVTGANGTVGSNLVRELLGNGYSVLGLVRPGADRSPLEGLSTELAEVDYFDPQRLAALCQGASCIFHLAARVSEVGSLDEFLAINVEMTRSVVQAAFRAGVPRLVYVSSAVVYGTRSRRNLCETDACEELELHYPRTKQLAEQYLLGLKGIETVIVRGGDVFGPRDRVATPVFLAAAETGFFPTIGSGDTMLCYTYIDNLTRGIRLAAERGRAGEVYNISDGIELTLKEYIKVVAETMEKKVRLVRLPYFIAYPAAALSEAVGRWFRVAPRLTRYRVQRAARDCHMSIAKARRELGYEPDLNLSEQVRAQVRWYREHCRKRSAPESRPRGVN